MKALIHIKSKVLIALFITLVTASPGAAGATAPDPSAETAPGTTPNGESSAEPETSSDSGAVTPADRPQSDSPASSAITADTNPPTSSAETPGGETPQTDKPEMDSPPEERADESDLIEVELIRDGPVERPWRSQPNIVRILADAVVGPEEVANDFVVIGGKGTVDGRLRGEGVVIFGNAQINGRIDGDFVNFMGSTTLGPDAEIDGRVVVIGGRLTRAEGSRIQGDVVELTLLPNFSDSWVGEWFRSGFLMGRPLPHDKGWAWMAAGLLLLIALVISLIFRRAIGSTAQVLDSKPAASLLTGLLVFILCGPLSLLLTVSVVGILIIPFYMAALMVASVFGIIAVYRFCGQQMGLTSMPTLSLLAGGVVFTLLYAVPVVGFLVWFLALILGTGAVFLALFKALNGEYAASARVGVPMSPVAPLESEPTRPSTPQMAGDRPESDMHPGESEPLPQATAITATPDDPLMAERVGFWPRLGATALDFILIAGLISFIGQDRMLPFAWIAYHVAFWTWRQTTIGGIVLNLKVVRLDGQRLNFGVVAVRSLSSIFSGLVMGLGFFWASWDDERQSWHDKIAGTTIIRMPKGTSLL